MIAGNAEYSGLRHMNKRVWAGLLMLAGLAAPAFGQTATFKEKQGDWSVYAYDAGSKKTCFAVAQPRTKKPAKVRRDPVYFYVSNWPKDKVTGEISLKMGYPLKPGVPAEVKIASATFQLFTKDEVAYVEKTEDEQKVITAMKAGATMIVNGRSTRGTLTTDTYSLTGISKALEAAAKACQ